MELYDSFMTIYRNNKGGCYTVKYNKSEGSFYNASVRSFYVNKYGSKKNAYNKSCEFFKEKFGFDPRAYSSPNCTQGSARFVKASRRCGQG